MRADPCARAVVPYTQRKHAYNSVADEQDYHFYWLGVAVLAPLLRAQGKTFLGQGQRCCTWKPGEETETGELERF